MFFSSIHLPLLIFKMKQHHQKGILSISIHFIKTVFGQSTALVLRFNKMLGPFRFKMKNKL